jgi:hypothetical protein
MPHLDNNGRDRELGAKWERAFCGLAFSYGLTLTPNQLPRSSGAASWYRKGSAGISRFLLPDVAVWSAPGEHHEVKHKDPTRFGCYGLELYRLEALVAFAEEVQQAVLYTIHDWRLAGAATSADEMPNRIEDWRTVDVRELAAAGAPATPMPTYLNGDPATVPGAYWPIDLWIPLADWWQPF